MRNFNQNIQDGKKLPYKLEFFINLIDRNTILISLVHIDNNILNLVNYSFNISIFLNYINRNIDENTRINNLSKIHNNNNNFEISYKKRYIYLFMKNKLRLDQCIIIKILFNNRKIEN